MSCAVDAGARQPEEPSPGTLKPIDGCTLAPHADWICRAQQIGAHALVCTDAASLSYESSAYDEDACYRWDRLWCAP